MNAIRLLPLCALNVGRLISRGSMARTAADILVDREDAIAYKQLGRHPKDPTMAPVL
jgi:hypothetical protein